MNVEVKGHTLMLIGLAGIAVYEIALHANLHSALQTDLNHGLWIGACLGLKILGLMLMKQEQRAR